MKWRWEPCAEKRARCLRKNWLPKIQHW